MKHCNYAVTEGVRNVVAAKGTGNLTGTNQSIVCELTGIKRDTDDLTYLVTAIGLTPCGSSTRRW